MDATSPFEIGMRTEQSFEVREEDSAGHVGSGSLRVLATPSMIMFMERTARIFMDERLPGSQTSVGVHVDISHLAATPVGMNIRVTCEIAEVNGRRVDFNVEIWDEVEKVGEGSHQRYVIDKDRFLKRLEAKLSNTGMGYRRA
jgi:fluoroacetyl-CoA thioesterase